MRVVLMFVLVVLCFPISLFAQNDSAFLNIKSEIVDSGENSKLYLLIDFTSKISSPINIISETSLSEFRCNYNAGVWMIFERLNESCFQEHGLDCNVPLYLSKPKAFRNIKSGESVSYKFEIGSAITRRNSNFTGVYRIKLYHGYKLKGKDNTVGSRWYYLNFSN